MEKTRILIVDDEPILAHALARSLANLGYEIAGKARSGDQAFELALETRPDLVLMDIELGAGMNGIEAAVMIKASLDVPVVFLTGHSDTGVLEKAKLANPAGYLLKPFEHLELRSTIEIGLHQHELECRLRERERWMEAVLSSIGDAVIAVDALGTVQWVNPRAEELTGIPAVESYGQPFESVLRLAETERPAGGDDERLIDQVLIGQRSIVNLVVAIERADGTRQNVELSASAIEVGQNMISGAVVVFRRPA
jgi:hypothetical protein